MKTLEEYLDLPYSVVVTQDRDDGVGYIAEIGELPGVISQGDTPSEAMERARDAMVGWLSVAIEDGLDIPEPGDVEHSGRFVLRLPSGLHARLAREAERQGVSLNQFTAAALAGVVGWRAGPPTGRR
jgi:predicted RNase H-like HicB family nuclease